MICWPWPCLSSLLDLLFLSPLGKTATVFFVIFSFFIEFFRFSGPIGSLFWGHRGNPCEFLGFWPFPFGGFAFLRPFHVGVLGLWKAKRRRSEIHLKSQGFHFFIIFYMIFHYFSWNWISKNWMPKYQSEYISTYYNQSEFINLNLFQLSIANLNLFQLPITYLNLL